MSTSVASPWRGAARFLAISTLALTLTGCSVSYPAGTIADAITELCEKEHGLEVKVKVVEQTLWVYVPLEVLIDDTLQVAKSASEAIENTVLIMHRVLLSTDADIQFYVMVASDTASMGAEFTLIGYVPDIKRARLLDISRGEYNKRILRDVTVNPAAIGDREGTHITLSNLQMPQFLAEQIIRRVKNAIMFDPENSLRFTIHTIDWDYQEGVFKLYVYADDALPDERPTLLDRLAREAAQVFYGYRFKDFTELEITDLTSYETLRHTYSELNALR